jgi:hypothetical protein
MLCMGEIKDLVGPLGNDPNGILDKSRNEKRSSDKRDIRFHWAKYIVKTVFDLRQDCYYRRGHGRYLGSRDSG